jgi:hypothetical protein
MRRDPGLGSYWLPAALRVASSPSNARLRQGLISALLDDVVTFTCHLFETVSINDLDTASAIADEPFSLKPSGEKCNGALPAVPRFARAQVYRRGRCA